ncbi:MAG TPA: hypothetical protein VFY61_16750 [Pyrinomonadaceae bacterium]|nr:hypothetical protein [Pyrinomonadaceae bacterium]
MRTRTEITYEMDRLVVVNRSRNPKWCNACSRPVEMLSVDDAALVVERLADRPQLAETLAALFEVILSHPWPPCSHQPTPS